MLFHIIIYLFKCANIIPAIIMLTSNGKPSACDLGVILDSNLCFESQITKVYFAFFGQGLSQK